MENVFLLATHIIVDRNWIFQCIEHVMLPPIFAITKCQQYYQSIRFIGDIISKTSIWWVRWFRYATHIVSRMERNARRPPPNLPNTTWTLNICSSSSVCRSRWWWVISSNNTYAHMAISNHNGNSANKLTKPGSVNSFTRISHHQANKIINVKQSN